MDASAVLASFENGCCDVHAKKALIEGAEAQIMERCISKMAQKMTSKPTPIFFTSVVRKLHRSAEGTQAYK
jgi:hypothetical protein